MNKHVPADFKPSALGPIPNTWEVMELGNIANRVKTRNTENNQNALTISAKLGLVNQKAFFNKIVASKNVSNYFLLRKGDFSYNKSYSAGYPMGVIKRLELYEKGIVSPLYICFNINSELALPDFYSHFFESGHFNSELASIAQEGARNHGLLNVGVNDFFDLVVTLPPLYEQRKIAAVLSSADRSIAATEKLIAKLTDLKKSLMQQLLTKGIGHTEFKHSPLGPIPKRWEVKLLTDVISKIIDCEHKTTPFIDNGKYFVVRTNSIKDGQIIFEDAKYTHEEAFREWTQREIPQPGDVLFTREAPAGEAALVPANLPLCLGQRMVLLKFNHDVNSAFFVYSLYGSEMRKCLNDMLIGTTVSRINMADIKLINCLIPPLDEQRKIADILNGVDRKLSAAKVKLAKAKNLKQGLMNDLLTGRRRVNIQ